MHGGASGGKSGEKSRLHLRVSSELLGFLWASRDTETMQLSAAQWLEDVRNGWRWWAVVLGQHLAASGRESMREGPKRSEDSSD